MSSELIHCRSCSLLGPFFAVGHTGRSVFWWRQEEDKHEPRRHFDAGRLLRRTIQEGRIGLPTYPQDKVADLSLVLYSHGIRDHRPNGALPPFGRLERVVEGPLVPLERHVVHMLEPFLAPELIKVPSRPRGVPDHNGARVDASQVRCHRNILVLTEQPLQPNVLIQNRHVAIHVRDDVVVLQQLPQQQDFAPAARPLGQVRKVRHVQRIAMPLGVGQLVTLRQLVVRLCPVGVLGVEMIVSRSGQHDRWRSGFWRLFNGVVTAAPLRQKQKRQLKGTNRICVCAELD
mmetsp:Transcript_17665/g.67192  ORF Transcript_17665/g.67192 Transcript_17665/m.67192 type:complete len:288 (+) Transcript_17665:457-1320(+)